MYIDNAQVNEQLCRVRRGRVAVLHSKCTFERQARTVQELCWSGQAMWVGRFSQCPEPETGRDLAQDIGRSLALGALVPSTCAVTTPGARTVIDAVHASLHTPYDCKPGRICSGSIRSTFNFIPILLGPINASSPVSPCNAPNYLMRVDKVDPAKIGVSRLMEPSNG